MGGFKACWQASLSRVAVGHHCLEVIVEKRGKMLILSGF
jgi:hypothetical protein